MNQKRRRFLRQLTTITAGALAYSAAPTLFSACSHLKPNRFDISLAQWSLHKTFFDEGVDPLQFPEIASKEFEIQAIEYVNQFFIDKAGDQSFLNEMKTRCDNEGVKSLLIMIDQEGALGAPDTREQKAAVEKHYKWIDVAAFWGCHSIRVNLHGDGTAEEWKQSSVDSLGMLSEYGKQRNINILVENHGRYSSNASLVAGVIKEVNHSHCGTLPDFGNFCLKREGDQLWGTPCLEWYDRYKGVRELIPFAKGVSAKTFAFDENGEETTIDYQKMMDIIKDSSYKGYIGIEYEGEKLSEKEGIKATKRLIERCM